MSLPAIKLMNELGVVTTKLHLQILVRCVLALANVLGLCLLRRVVARRFTYAASVFFTLLSCTQFHLLFWAGRTIPNMLALPLVNVACSLLLTRSSSPSLAARNCMYAIGLLGFSAAIFRIELAMLAAPLALQCLLRREVLFSQLLKFGSLVLLLAVAFTVLVDSYLWQQWPLWPEFHSFYFNVYEGKSSDWGVSPPLEYITHHIPKLALSALPLACFGAIIDSRLRWLLLPAVAFVGLISCIKHKEWRFVVYVVPLLNASASRAAAWLWMSPRYPKLQFFTRIAVFGLLSFNAAVAIALTAVSIANYPGGEALSRFNDMYADTPRVHVHLCNYAAQTGATLFLQEHTPPFGHLSEHAPAGPIDWVYNKTEGLSAADLASGSFTHAIVEDWTDQRYSPRQWRVAATVPGFGDVQLRDPTQSGLARFLPSIRRPTKLWILERNLV